MLKDFLRFWWFRNSASAEILCIGVAEYMDNKDAIDLAEYLKSLVEARKRRATEPCHGNFDG